MSDYLTVAKIRTKISLIVLVYNHEQYIKKALLSFLEQNLDFEYQIIVSNDCSKDKSDAVIQSVLQTHPKASSIEYYNQTSNLGLIDNFLFCLEKARGEYIALCGGDDFWIDSLKLKKQSNFLDNNKEFSAVTSDTYYLENGTYRKYTYVQTKAAWLNERISTSFSFRQIANRFFPHPNSLLFRNGIQLPYDFRTYICEDFPLFLLLANCGKIGFIDEVQTVYRLHSESLIHSTKSVAMENNIHFLKILFSINIYLNRKYESAIVRAIQSELLRLFIIHTQNNDRVSLKEGVKRLEGQYDLKVINTLLFFKFRVACAKNSAKETVKALFRRLAKN